ncbi:MAG: class I SAM-dependent methyltransferase [Candidatus Margulisiibacteriota bacterium]|jgi:SAM-dependent methyltransferase
MKILKKVISDIFLKAQYRISQLALNNRRLKYQYLRLAVFLGDLGFQPPLASLDLAKRWEKQGTEGSADRPETYIKEDNSLVELFKEVLPYLNKESKILELGCNVGRSLNYLHKLGFKNLTGIEIGPKAVEMSRTVFPEMARDSKLIVGSAPLEIKKLPTAEYDLVFCHSVLVNIHPKYNYLFKEMSRVSKKLVLILENEGSLFAYPRDFQKSFERVGLKMVMSKIFAEGCRQFPDPYEEKDIYSNNTIRLFAKDKSH